MNKVLTRPTVKSDRFPKMIPDYEIQDILKMAKYLKELVEEPSGNISDVEHRLKHNLDLANSYRKDVKFLSEAVIKMADRLSELESERWDFEMRVDHDRKLISRAWKKVEIFRNALKRYAGRTVEFYIGGGGRLVFPSPNEQKPGLPFFQTEVWDVGCHAEEALAEEKKVDEGKYDNY